MNHGGGTRETGEREEVKMYSGGRVQGLINVGIEGKAQIKTDSGFWLE